MPKSARPAVPTTAHINELITNIRPDDAAEIRGLGHSPLALHMSVQISEFATTMLTPEGAVAGIVGVVDEGNRTGQIWMVCTPAIEKYPLTFVRNARKWLPFIEQNYDLLHNIVSIDNEVHKRLIKNMGFKGLRYVQPPPYYKPYIEFSKLCVSP